MKSRTLLFFAAIASSVAQPAWGYATPPKTRNLAPRDQPNRSAVKFSGTSSKKIYAEDDTNPVYYIAWFIPPSGAVITDFVSTMSVPNLSPNPDIGPRYVWPGMENAAYDFVFQDVLGDDQPEGEWTFATWYVGEGQEQEYTVHNVSPGDTTTSTFKSADQSGINWSESFTSTGPEGASGSVNSVSFTSEGALVNALFAIELWDGAQWDFGSVTWSAISITAITSDTTWCTSPSFQAPSGVTNFQYSLSTPKATVNGNSVTCTVDKLTFISP